MARTREWASRSLGIRWPGGFEYLGEAGLALGHKEAPSPRECLALHSGKGNRPEDGEQVLHLASLLTPTLGESHLLLSFDPTCEVG